MGFPGLPVPGDLRLFHRILERRAPQPADENRRSSAGGYEESSTDSRASRLAVRTHLDPDPRPGDSCLLTAPGLAAFVGTVLRLGGFLTATTDTSRLAVRNPAGHRQQSCALTEAASTLRRRSVPDAVDEIAADTIFRLNHQPVNIG